MYVISFVQVSLNLVIKCIEKCIRSFPIKIAYIAICLSSKMHLSFISETYP